MRLLSLRDLNLCILDEVQNLQQKNRIVRYTAETVNAILNKNDSLQPHYLTLFLKASKEVQEQSDPWFEVFSRVERPDMIILLCEQFDRVL
ncbi:unnamed protein product [Gongylonema pulchrum]|uniref:PhoH domain-containing protein n=1 Tax=Gongylonema pulchrum TaxID=637853 RepID=A0A183DA88_9BILA|nr:unnamed protein product [Gongylonema pulchrum]